MTEVQSVYKTIVVMGNVLHEEEMEEESFEGAGAACVFDCLSVVCVHLLTIT